MKPIEGTFTNPTTVRLRTGQTITSVVDHSDYVGHACHLGWLAGGLYVSLDGGATWAASGLAFRAA
jgi:hypothetical protein